MEKLLGNLISLRLLQLTSEFNVVRIHRLVQELVRQRNRQGATRFAGRGPYRPCQKTWRGVFFTDWVNPETRWELEPLAACAGHWMGMDAGNVRGPKLLIV